MKKFFLDKSQIKQLIQEMGYCYASNEITLRGRKVGYMYREKPEREDDSGWRFFAGDEPEEYTNTPDNFAIYSVNTIANYDPDIIPHLKSSAGTTFERNVSSNKFVQVGLDHVL